MFLHIYIFHACRHFKIFPLYYYRPRDDIYHVKRYLWESIMPFPYLLLIFELLRKRQERWHAVFLPFLNIFIYDSFSFHLPCSIWHAIILLLYIIMLLSWAWKLHILLHTFLYYFILEDAFTFACAPDTYYMSAFHYCFWAQPHVALLMTYFFDLFLSLKFLYGDILLCYYIIYYYIYETWHIFIYCHSPTTWDIIFMPCLFPFSFPSLVHFHLSLPLHRLEWAWAHICFSLHNHCFTHKATFILHTYT